MNKRVLAVFLAVSIVLTAFSANLFAVGQTSKESSSFKDMSNHWAADKVSSLVEKGLISGYDDKTFRPDSNITRAEFAKIIDRVFGYQFKANEEFKDVKATDWYHDVVSRVRNAGAISGYGNSFSPNSPITRQDAAVIVAKAFELSGLDISKAQAFKDKNDIKNYAANSISALVLKGYLKGYEDNTFRPLKNLTRAETVALVYNVTGEILSKKGEYSQKTQNSNLIINTSDITVKNITIKGDLYLTEGIGEGEATFDNVTVEGSTYIKGGGTHSIKFNNSSLGNVFVLKKNSPVRVAIEGKSTVTTITVINKAIIEVSEGISISKLIIENSAEGTEIKGKGTIGIIEVKAKNTIINGMKAEENTIYIMEAGEAGVKPAAIPSPSTQATATLAPTATPTSTSVPAAPSSVHSSSTQATATPTSTSVITSPSPSQYTLVWEDNFDEATINGSNWTAADTGEVYNNELEAYKPANAYVEEGSLVLEAKPEEYKGKNYSSGKVVTKGKQFWTYGRFEIKAKMPETQGIWPAIWMLPEDDNIFGGWPTGGEIDILELLGHEPNRIYGTVHYGNPHASGQGTYALDTGKFSDDYHLYAFEWDPGEMRWYIDGNLFYTEKSWYSRDENEADALTYPAPFNRDFHLIINLAVGGDWPKNPDDSTVFPAKMYVDYVKVYERNGGIYPPAGERPQINNSSVRQPLQDGNYIYNGSFDQEKADADGMKNVGSDTDITNTSYWTYSHVSANDGTAEASNDNGALKLDISNPGQNTYSVQVYQKPVNVEKSESYRVTFDAWASVDRNIAVKIGSEADRGWANYSGDQIIPLTTSSQTHTFDFKMTGDTNSAARLEFNVGAAGTNTVWIDNVRVEKLPSDPNTPRAELPNGNLIYNGTFDQGSKSMGFWDFKTKDGADATGSVTNNIFDREFEATITNEGTGADSIVLSQSGLNLEGGKQYSVSFHAKADSNRSIKADVCSTADTLVDYSTEKSFDLTTEMTSYSFKFTMGETTDPKAQFRIKLGGNTSKVYIDNVIIRSSSKGTHVEAEAADANGAITPQDSHVTFGADSYISKSITVPETGSYVISYRLSTSDANGWLSIGDVNHKETLPDTGGNANWVNVTNSVQLNKGQQVIKIYGNAVNLDWFEISKDLVLGGSMTPSASNWAYWNTDKENANSTKSVEDGKLKVAITAAGNNPWSIGVNQSNISLEQGRLYRISFDARSTSDRSIRVAVESKDYDKYFSQDLDITTTMKNYIIDFPMSATDSNSTLTFSIGTVPGKIASSAHDVYLDNVRLVEVTDLYCQKIQSIEAPVIPEPSVIPEPPDDGTNIITDGKFESGKGAWDSYSGAGAVSIDAVDGKLVADVTKVASTNYEPQVKRPDLSLTGNKTYTLTINASASVDRAVQVSVVDPADNYKYFGGNIFEITSSAADYTFKFTAPATTSTAELQFNFGTIEGYESTSVASTVSIDNVRLVEFKNPDEVDSLINNNFDSGMGSWSFGANGGAGSAEVVTNDNNKELCVDVTTVGQDNYQPQLQKSNLTLESGAEYQLTFKARATVARTVEVSFLDPQKDYHWFGGSRVSVTDQTQTFTVTFTADASTTTAALQINFGTIKDDNKNPLPSGISTIYLDDIVVVKK